MGIGATIPIKWSVKMIKRKGIILICIGFMLVAGCDANEVVPTPPPAPGSVIGYGILKVQGNYSDSSLTAQQYVLEQGDIPFEIQFDSGGVHDTKGKGVSTVSYEIHIPEKGLICTYQAIANVDLSGELFETGESPFTDENSASGDQSICSFNFTLKFSYPSYANLLNGNSELCGPLKMGSSTVEVNEVKAANGTKVKLTGGGLDQVFTISNLEIEKIKGCEPPPAKSDLK